jgi:hypothetical protein
MTVGAACDKALHDWAYFDDSGMRRADAEAKDKALSDATLTSCKSAAEWIAGAKRYQSCYFPQGSTDQCGIAPGTTNLRHVLEGLCTPPAVPKQPACPKV